ncbi:glucose-1-phosphate thymidylyltransferase [Candidatus Riflebacteria bacterium]
MRALILCAGKGTRLRPITHSFPKHLIPILNKPVVQYGVESCIVNGIKEIAFIVNSDYEQFYEIFGDGKDFGSEFTYIVQKRPRGLGDAILSGRDFIGDHDFIVFLGDNFLKEGFSDLKDNFQKEHPDAALFLTGVDNPQAFGIASVEGGRVIKVEEKPKNPASNLAIVGAYFFKPSIFKVIETLEPSKRGEIEITDAIQKLIESGARILPQLVGGWWRDTGNAVDIIDTNLMMLDEMDDSRNGIIDENSEIRGRVVVKEGARIVSSSLRGPILVGKNAVVENSFIGPYTVLGRETKLINSEIEHSVVMAGSKIQDVEGRIESSLIGHHVEIRRKKVKPEIHQFIIGDNSQIILR